MRLKRWLTIIWRGVSRERQERKCFSFLYCTTLYQAEARKAKMVIRTLNSSPGALPFSINVSNATPETQFIRH